MSERVLTSYYRPKPGGFCRRYFRAIHALCERGHEVHALSVQRFPIDHPNYHWHRFPWPARWTDNYPFWLCFHLLAPWMLLFIAIRHRIDRLFAFSPTYALLLQPARWWRQCPLVVFMRADSIENHRLLARPSWLIRLELALERIALRGTHVFAVSRALADAVSDRHDDLRTDVYPNDVPQSAGHDANATGISGDIRFACVGVLEPRKRQRFILEVLGDLSPSCWRLDLFGDGVERRELERLASRLQIGGRTVFHGWVSPEMLWKKVDVLLFPSQHEGAPNAVLEALAHRVPVLASDIPEHREVLPHENLLPPQDRQAWRARLEKLLADPVVEGERLRVAQETVRTKLTFDWDAGIVQLIVNANSAVDRCVR